MSGTDLPQMPSIVARLATIGRLGLSVSGLVALLAVIVNFRDGNTLALLIAVVGCLAMIACAVLGQVKPFLRIFDLAAFALAALLAGSFMVWGFGFSWGGGSVLSLLSWILMLAFGGLTGAGLGFGPPVADDGFNQQVSGAFSSRASAQPQYGYAAPGQPQPGTAAYPPPGQYTPPGQAQYSPPSQYPPPGAEPAEGTAAEAEAQVELTAEEASAPDVAVEQAVDSSEAAEQAAAGWYPQADGVTARYWTGSEWSDDIKPISELT